MRTRGQPPAVVVAAAPPAMVARGCAHARTAGQPHAEAAAWYLHDLAAQLPARWPARYTKDELLALGYNAGPGNMTAFARGGKPGSVAQSYLDRLHANWDAAAQALR